MEQFEDQSLKDFIRYARRSLLDHLEASYGQTPQWPLCRQRVMQIFGRSGLGRFIDDQQEDGDYGTESKINDYKKS